MKKAFTLLEVNLAMLVMAGGILSIVTLYSLGFRESSQSNEDVASSALADAVLGRAAMALSDTNLTWATFNSIDNQPPDGWAGYFDSRGEVISSPESKAAGIFSDLISRGAAGSGVSPATTFDTSILKTWGLTVFHAPDSAVVHLSFRAARKPKTLMSAPIYYTAVAFQGRNETETGTVNNNP